MTPTSLDYAASTSPLSPALRWLHRYCVLMVFATLFLICAGGMVTSTGSGLSVPDWPTTYGQNMFTYPYEKWVGGIFWEHGHRLIASTVGFLTIVLAVWVQICEKRRWVRRLGWAALLTVIAQGVLGGLTVIYLLPTPISVFHGCLAQGFFCITIALAVATSRWWRRFSESARVQSTSLVRRACLGLTAVVFLQLVLGAIMRHTESGLAVPDFPLAYGKWVPSLSAEAVESYNHSRRWEWWLPQVTVDQIVYHLAHRVGAVVATGMLLATVGLVLRRHGRITALRRPAVAALFLLAAQIGLGAWTVWSTKAPFVATAHVAVGAATLGVSWLLTLSAYRSLSCVRDERAPTAALTGVVG